MFKQKQAYPLVWWLVWWFDPVLNYLMKNSIQFEIDGVGNLLRFYHNQTGRVFVNPKTD